MKRLRIYLSMKISVLIFFYSCSKESYVEEIYPSYKARLNYDSTTLYFPNMRGSLGGMADGTRLSGCLTRDDKQRFCLEIAFDTLISSFDLKDSLEGKTFYFVSNEDYPHINLSHEIDDIDYNDFDTRLDVNGDYFLFIEEIKALPVGNVIFNTQFVPWTVKGSFKSQFENGPGKIEETSGNFLLYMEYVVFVP